MKNLWHLILHIWRDCPYKGCGYGSDNDDDFRTHLASHAGESL